MFRDKKGVIGETINLGFATILIVVLSLLFFLFSGIIRGGISGSLTEKSEDLVLKQEAENSLIAYLKTPVIIQRNDISQDILMVDLIRLSVNEKAYEELLKSKSLEIFDGVYDEYSLSIGDIEVKTTAEKISTASKKIAFIDIPLNQNEEKMRVILMIK